MDMGKIIEWMKDVGSSGKVIIAVVAIIAFALYPDSFSKLWEKPASNPASTNNYSSQGKQVIAPVNASDHATVSQNFGDTHHHGLNVEDAMKLAEKLAAEKGEKDAQVIKSLQETIQALTRQSARKYDIKQALDLLAEGDTAKAEAIFTGVAAEARKEGQEANIKEAEAMRHLGALAYLHDTKKAFDAYKRSTELDPENWDGWYNLGHLYRRIGDIQNAENAFKIVLKLSKNNKNGQAAAYGSLGILSDIRGNLDQAVEYYLKALVIEKELENKRAIARIYGNLGLIHQAREDLSQAVEYHQKALTINQDLGDRKGIAINYANLGAVYKSQWNLDQAIDFDQKALKILLELGDKEGIATLNGNLGNVYLMRGELDRAIEFYQEALTIAKELGYKEGMANQYDSLGLIHSIRGDLDQAVEYHQKALDLNKELERRESMAINYRNLGVVFERKGDRKRAIDYWKQSLGLFQHLGAKNKITTIQSWIDEFDQKDSNQ